MSKTKDAVSALLSNAGYSIGVLDTEQGIATTFENDKVLGFVLYYLDVATLVSNWKEHSSLVIDQAQFLLRTAGEKAWNTYLILLADQKAAYAENFLLGDIEENLVGTRKIARAGVVSPTELRNALLPLLSIQNPPKLEKVDMEKEIRLRTSEFPEELVDGFLSHATDAVLLQMLESAE